MTHCATLLTGLCTNAPLSFKVNDCKFLACLLHVSFPTLYSWVGVKKNKSKAVSLSCFSHCRQHALSVSTTESTPCESETDYVCHKHATEMHKIPHDTCKCRLCRPSSWLWQRQSGGPNIWYHTQIFVVLERKKTFFKNILSSSTTALHFSLETLTRFILRFFLPPGGDVSFHPLRACIAAYIFTGRLLYRGFCLEKDPPICKSKPLAVARTISAS